MRERSSSVRLSSKRELDNKGMSVANVCCHDYYRKFMWDGIVPIFHHHISKALKPAIPTSNYKFVV